MSLVGTMVTALVVAVFGALRKILAKRVLPLFRRGPKTSDQDRRREDEEEELREAGLANPPEAPKADEGGHRLGGAGDAPRVPQPSGRQPEASKDASKDAASKDASKDAAAKALAGAAALARLGASKALPMVARGVEEW